MLFLHDYDFIEYMTTTGERGPTPTKPSTGRTIEQVTAELQAAKNDVEFYKDVTVGDFADFVAKKPKPKAEPDPELTEEAARMRDEAEDARIESETEARNAYIPVLEEGLGIALGFQLEAAENNVARLTAEAEALAISTSGIPEFSN